MINNVRWIAALSLLFTLGMGRALGGEGEVVARIVGDWKKKQERITAIHWVTRGEALFLKGYFNDSGGKMFPGKDTKVSKEVEWLVDFSKNWTKRDWKGFEFYWGSGSFYRSHVVDVSDGRKMVQLARREQNKSEGGPFAEIQPDIMLKGTAFKDDFFLLNDFPLFLGNGRIITNKHLPNGLNLACPVSADDFVLHGKAVFQGRDCYVLRSKERDVPFYEYWVDATRESAVLRWANYIGAHMAARLDFVYQESASGLVPASWALMIFRPSDKGYVLGCEEKMRVDKFVVNPSLEIGTYQLAPETGMNVAEEGRIYQLQADGSKKVLYTYPTSSAEGGTWGRTGAWGAILLVAFIVGLVLWKSFIRKRGSKT